MLLIVFTRTINFFSFIILVSVKLLIYIIYDLIYYLVLNEFLLSTWILIAIVNNPAVYKSTAIVITSG